MTVESYGPAWRKSSFSIGSQACVELAPREGGVLVRDSKYPDDKPLSFTHKEWRAFIAGVRHDEFDHLLLEDCPAYPISREAEPVSADRPSEVSSQDRLSRVSSRARRVLWSAAAVCAVARLAVMIRKSHKARRSAKRGAGSLCSMWLHTGRYMVTMFLAMRLVSVIG